MPSFCLISTNGLSVILLNCNKDSLTHKIFSLFPVSIIALALYPALTLTFSGIFTLAFITNCTAPACSIPLGATKVNFALNSSSSKAPNTTLISEPSSILETSVSSTCPSNIIIVMSATVAIVVPALKLLLSIT